MDAKVTRFVAGIAILGGFVWGSAAGGGHYAYPEKKTRPAALAGAWYPADAVTLKNLLDGNMDRVKAAAPLENLRAIIVPHAGYAYSGWTAAHAFKRLRGRSFKRVVAIGPAHRHGLAGISVPDVTHYQTPLGEIPLDAAALGSLRRSPYVQSVPAAHREEHAIEMQLPYLQRVLKQGWRLVPILAGAMGEAGLQAAAEVIRPLLDRETLLVISGDFTHYGPRYGYEPFPRDDRTVERAADLDGALIQRIDAGDPAGLIETYLAQKNNACVLMPAALLLRLAAGEGTFHLLKRATSAEAGGGSVDVVGYAAGALTAKRPFSLAGAIDPLPEREMAALLGMARRSVGLAAAGVAQGEIIATVTREFPIPPGAGAKGAAFVTLREKGALRGCIGHVAPYVPLYRSVIENAAAAAREDPRFSPVAPAALPGLEIDVSVLSPLRPIDSAADFIVGRHGVVLEKQGKRAVFLPSVALEQGWDRETTLDALARKAGLPPGAWRNGAALWIFTSQTRAGEMEGEE